MNFSYISSLIIPFLILTIIIYGLKKKIKIYDTFVDGAKESFEMTFNIFPNLLGMILAINILIKSGILEFFLNFLSPMLSYFKIPVEILPIALMRPISGSSSLVLLNNILINYGPDSFIGRVASLIQGTNDTTFYILTLYFGCIGIKKIRYSLWAGLFADLAGVIMSIIFVNLLFN